MFFMARKIDLKEKAVDRLVEAIYGLTRIIEGAEKAPIRGILAFPKFISADARVSELLQDPNLTDSDRELFGDNYRRLFQQAQELHRKYPGEICGMSEYKFRSAETSQNPQYPVKDCRIRQRGRRAGEIYLGR